MVSLRGCFCPAHLADATADNVSVYQVLEKGLEDLMNMCDVVTDKFTVSKEQFINQMEQ